MTDSGDHHEVAQDKLNNNMSEKPTAVSWLPALGKRIDEDEKTSVGGNPDRIAFYDKHADTYTEDHLAMEYTGPIKTAELIHKYLKGKTDAKILDVGCGTGLVLKEMHKLAAYNNVHGLDPSTAMTDRAQKEDPYQKIHSLYFKVDSGIEHNSYDAVVCCGAFIPGHIRGEAFKELIDIAKPGGYVVNVMRGILLDVDTSFKQIKPLVQELKQKRTLEVIEDHMYDGYFANFEGHVYVIRKIK